MERSKSVAGAIAIAGVLALALVLTLADADADADANPAAVAVAVASAVAAAVALGGSGVLALILAISIAILGAAGLLGVVLVAVAGAGGVIVAVGVGVASVLAGDGFFGGVVLGIASCAVAGASVGAVISGVRKLNDIAIRNHRQGVFLLLYIFTMMIICLSAATLLVHFEGWEYVGPVLLFLGLLTLINAPFDWASLGLTRALLRRGLELGGWWPYFLALADALAAAGIIAILATTMVIGVQAFDHLAEHSGGAKSRVLPLDALFAGIAAHPTAPEYWWLYALLLSTMIPSLVNLMISGASLLRGIPGLSALLLQFMPAGKAVPAFDRAWLALVLTCQIFAGAFLGIATQAFLAMGVLYYMLPWMGLELLHTARNVAEFDLPMRVLRPWLGNP